MLRILVWGNRCVWSNRERGDLLDEGGFGERVGADLDLLEVSEEEKRQNLGINIKKSP